MKVKVIVNFRGFMFNKDKIYEGLNFSPDIVLVKDERGNPCSIHKSFIEIIEEKLYEPIDGDIVG